MAMDKAIYDKMLAEAQESFANGWNDRFKGVEYTSFQSTYWQMGWDSLDNIMEGPQCRKAKLIEAAKQSAAKQSAAKTD